MYNQTLPEITADSLNLIWTSLIIYIPKVLLAIVLFAVFLIIAAAFESVVERIVRMLKIDALLSKIGVEAWVSRLSMRLDTGRFLGVLVKWFFILSGLLVAANLLGLSNVSTFLIDIISYIPNVVVAAIILIAGAVLADVVGKAAGKSIAASGLHAGPFVDKVVRWAIVIFAFIGAMEQLGVAQTFINTLYIGIVAMIAIAGGLAFGLGGKEHASEFIAKVKRDITH